MHWGSIDPFTRLENAVPTIDFDCFCLSRESTTAKPQLNNQQRASMPILVPVSVDFHGVHSQCVMSRTSIRFEWSSSRQIASISITIFIKHDNKLNSNENQNSNSNAMPQPQLNSNHQCSSNHCIALALGFDHLNQTRSSIHFEWNGRLGVELDHGQGVARPTLCQMKKT